jgi:hypothetical protein
MVERAPNAHTEGQILWLDDAPAQNDTPGGLTGAAEPRPIRQVLPAPALWDNFLTE